MNKFKNLKMLIKLNPNIINRTIADSPKKCKMR